LITEILDDLNNIVREINNIKNKRKAVWNGDWKSKSYIGIINRN
jgi:hypothetical protein